MTTILVGVDPSERARDALAFAREAAVASGATVVVAHTFPYDEKPSRANLGFRHFLEQDALALVGKLGRALGAEIGEERVRTAFAPGGSAAHGLHDLAERERAAMIVVGSSHVGAAGRVMPGSTGERLLHGAPCPVVIVPKGYRDAPRSFRRVGVAYDGSPESESALRDGVAIAQATGAELTIIRAMNTLDYSTPALMGGPGYVAYHEGLEDQLRSELEDVVGRLPEGVVAKGDFAVGDPADELAARSESLDLLLTGSRGYGPMRAVMAGGVTGRLLRHAACPVLVVPRGSESALAEIFAEQAETPV